MLNEKMLKELQSKKKSFEDSQKKLDDLNSKFISLKKEINKKCLSLIDEKKCSDKLEKFVKKYMDYFIKYNSSYDKNNIAIVDKKYCYDITIYTTEINFVVMKNNKRIGNFYYWLKNKNGMGDIQICFDEIHPILDYKKGIDLNYVKDFLDAFTNFFDNIDYFLKKITILYENELCKEQEKLNITLRQKRKENAVLQESYNHWKEELLNML